MRVNTVSRRPRVVIQSPQGGAGKQWFGDCSRLTLVEDEIQFGKALVGQSVRPGGCMQKSASLVVCFVILCGCTNYQCPDLKRLASGLEKPWPGPRWASMTITVRESGGHPVLHCRLQNSFGKALALDRSRLPWNQPIYFTGTVVTSTGRTYPIGPVAVLAYIVGSPNPFSVAPNAVVEGDFELKYLPKNPMVGPPPPRGEDTLLVWSYDLPTYGERPPPDLSTYDEQQMQSVRLTGITFLPKQSMRLLDQ